MTDTTRTGQLTSSAAEVYESFFVPALFREPAQHIVRSMSLQPGQRILDVACGTGVLAREAASALGSDANIVGVDLNDGMLAVAKERAPGIDWHTGAAENLPFADGTFDVAACQFGLMFFAERKTALKEMWRVVRPGGMVSIAVWAALERSPGYADMTALLDRLFGQKVREAMKVPFALGDPDEARTLFVQADIGECTLETIDVTARFPSLEDWVRTDIKGWTLADMVDDDGLNTLLHEARTELAKYVRNDGSVAFSSPAHILTARKPQPA